MNRPGASVVPSPSIYVETAGLAVCPLLSAHFNLTFELPLKAIVRGYSYEVIPISWRPRDVGISSLRLREMGSRYLFIVLYLWLEKVLTRGDYRRPVSDVFARWPPPGSGQADVRDPHGGM